MWIIIFIISFGCSSGESTHGTGKIKWLGLSTPSYNSQHGNGLCTSRDSKQMTSYVNNCAHQIFFPINACTSDSNWNCNALLTMCKSLVSQANQAAPQEPRFMHVQPPPREAPPTPSPTTTGSRVPRFSPDAEYFTMKQLAIAVLVSFITGAASVTCVILIVWRCRNCHISSKKTIEMAHFDAKRIAALHAITQIASAFGSGRDSNSGPTGVVNTVYNIPSDEILRDVLTEHDRVYEEIFFRRKSSARSQDNVYSNLDKFTRTSKSNSNLGAITENIEHDEDSTYDSPSRPYALCTKKLNNRVDTQHDSRSTPQGSPSILFSRNDVSNVSKEHDVTINVDSSPKSEVSQESGSPNMGRVHVGYDEEAAADTGLHMRDITPQPTPVMQRKESFRL